MEIGRNQDQLDKEANGVTVARVLLSRSGSLVITPVSQYWHIAERAELSEALKRIALEWPNAVILQRPDPWPIHAGR